MTQPLRSVPVMVEVEQIPDPAVEAETESRHIQAMGEGVSHGDHVECLGGRYRVADKVGLMPLLRFAHTAAAGVDTDDMEGLVAIWDMLHDCLHEDDWPRFVADMTAKKADADEMMPVVQQAIEIINARPTRQRSDSSSGPPPTGPSSTVTSSSRPGVEDLVPVDQLAQAL